MATQCYFRIQPPEEDPQRLLDPEGQRSAPWEGTIYGRCDKCGGRGRTDFRCESCRQGNADPDCPVCGGDVRYWASAPPVKGRARSTTHAATA